MSDGIAGGVFCIATFGALKIQVPGEDIVLIVRG